MLPFVFLSVNISQWSSKELEIGLPLLPVAERDAILRYRFKADQYRSLASQLLKRYLFVKYINLTWNSITFEKSAYGKPFIVTDGDDNVDFNVSHHGDWVVLAACTNGKIGVDVTRRDVPREDVDSFVNCFTDQLAEDEIQRLHSTKDKGLKLQLFYEIWCLKESLIKALGLGLHKDLKYANFMPVELGEHADEDKCNISLRDSQEPENNKLFRFNLSYIDKDHPVAICTSAQSSGAEDNLSRSGLRMGQSYADAQACGTPFSIISFNQIIQCTASKPDQ